MTYTPEDIVKAYGPYNPPDTFTKPYLDTAIESIRLFPDELTAFLNQVGPQNQNACYREGGWNFKQVTHHLADSHMQAFSRFKLALTEERPVIKPYSQNSWAGTADNTLDADISAGLIHALHKRWVALMLAMDTSDFAKIYIHPEYGREFSLAYAAGLYAWHGRHHLAQMQRYSVNMGWI